MIPALTVAGLALAGSAADPRPRGAIGAAAAAPALRVENCMEVGLGEAFEVEIRVSDVSQLLAWDIYYAYNREIVEVTDRDVRQFLESQQSSNVFDLSDPLPNSIGLYRLGAADTGGAGAAETGGGLLAVLTLQPKRKGISWSNLYRSDADHNGTIDIGPTLTALGGSHIGDIDGDGLFDGSLISGQIAVGTNCAASAPTPTLGAGVIVAPTPTLGPGVAPPTATPTSAASSDSPSPNATAAGATSETTAPFTTRSSDPPSTIGGGSNPESNGSLSTWLVAALAASASVGVLLTYAIYRTRRPA